MAFLFPSPEWANAYKDALNASAAYAEAGKDWTHGVVAMIVKAEPALGLPEDLGLWLDVHGGKCNSIKLVPAAEVEAAPFIIVATYAMWKSVIKKELDPIKGMMQNRLKLTKGHMPTIVKYVKSSRELVETTSKVPTLFRDEGSPPKEA
jgi:putative sterol carrier protein